MNSTPKFTCPTCASADIQLRAAVDNAACNGGYIVYQCDDCQYEWLATFSVFQTMPARAKVTAVEQVHAPDISKPKRRHRQSMTFDRYDFDIEHLKGRKLC